MRISVIWRNEERILRISKLEVNRPGETGVCKSFTTLQIDCKNCVLYEWFTLHSYLCKMTKQKYGKIRKEYSFSKQHMVQNVI